MAGTKEKTDQSNRVQWHYRSGFNVVESQKRTMLAGSIVLIGWLM
jgi:hypothetical protein